MKYFVPTYSVTKGYARNFKKLLYYGILLGGRGKAVN